MTDSGFRIRGPALALIIAHARDEAPVECCGLLVGGDRFIDEAVAAKNLAASPTRFLIDPKDHINARRAARDRGLEVVGFYHSHPHSPPLMSPTDIAEAAYPEAVHLILSLAGVDPEARLFRIEQGSAIELPLVLAV